MSPEPALLVVTKISPVFPDPPLLGIPVGLKSNWSDQLDFTPTGIPNSGGAGKTGDILVTTSNAGSGDTYLLILTLTKTYASV